MVKVQLPDGSIVEHSDGVTVAEVLRAISPRLESAAVAALVNGKTVDLFTPLNNTEVKLQALKIDDPEGLHVARHSCAHVMAEAICSLWPQTKLVYGPPVDDGFYYDIDLDHKLTPEDFEKIEARMKEIVKEDRPFRRYEMPRGEAMQKLADEGNEYKIDNAERAEGDTLSFYVTGSPNEGCFEDLCRGPHVPSTSRVGAFKIMQVAGAYHHGDASKQMLQRVYGTCWPDRKALQRHLQMLEEAKKRDHRRIGVELGLFTIDPLVGSGLVLWKPRGAVIRRTLEQFLLTELLRSGYQQVYTPQIGKLDLYRTSGHFPYYKDSQFPPLFESDTAHLLNELWEATAARGDAEGFSNGEAHMLAELERTDEDTARRLREMRFSSGANQSDHNQAVVRQLLSEGDGYLLRPMNCPHHIRIFSSEARSYRDLPVRLCEFGQVYRYEQSGEVSGMTRVRGFCQDDAHIFCTPDQLPQEIADCLRLSKFVLGAIGLDDYRVRIGLRDPDSSKYIGQPEIWDAAEDALRQAVRSSEMRFSEEPGEAAFYGPKVDFIVKDCIGREWQLGTVQVDYNLPKRFKLSYVGDDNAEHQPLMVHRALFGSIERFVGILIEHFAGKFPLWLAPTQVVVCNVSDKSVDYARDVFENCRKTGLRVEFDDSDDRIGAKIRRATMMKTPYILVVGEQEAADHSVNVRTRDGVQQGSHKLSEFLAACAIEIKNHGVATPAEPRQDPAQN